MEELFRPVSALRLRRPVTPGQQPFELRNYFPVAVKIGKHFQGPVSEGGFFHLKYGACMYVGTGLSSRAPPPPANLSVAPPPQFPGPRPYPNALNATKSLLCLVLQHFPLLRCRSTSSNVQFVNPPVARRLGERGEEAAGFQRQHVAFARDEVVHGGSSYRMMEGRGSLRV